MLVSIWLATLMDYKSYPNAHGHVCGDPQRGGLRTGWVVRNDDTQKAGTAGYPAMVTHEEDATVRFYIFTTTGIDSLFANTPLWLGPYTGLSEEIQEEQQS